MLKRSNDLLSCPLYYTLSVISGKWAAIILWHLSTGFEPKKRYGELKKCIPCITHKMLSQELRSLEDCGLVNRKKYDSVSPRVEYSLTEKGKSLIPVLQFMLDWGKDWEEDYCNMDKSKTV